VLLTNLNSVQPGMRVGAAVMNPKAPDVTLLKRGAELTSDIIARLRKRKVTQIWVEHELTRDLDEAVAPELARVKLKVYHHLKNGFEQLEQRTVTKSQVQSYRRAVVELVREIVAQRAFANLTDQLYDADNQLISHSSNVAYLATVVGLELESYLIRERSRLPAARARELINLGLGAMLHDIGKVELGPEASSRHEALESDRPRGDDAYRRHPAVGQRMLGAAVAAATVRHVVLAHHRRFDGTGWPDIVKLTAGGVRTQPAGRRLHIFTRIVSAANVLDNLLQAADGTRRPPVAALHDFAGAVVIAPNLAQPCRPSIRLLERPDGRSGGEPETVILTDHPKLHIVTCAGADVRKWVFQLADAEPRKAPPVAGRPEAA